MRSSMTLDQLAEAILGPELNSVIDQVDLESTISENTNQNLTVNDMADRYLEPQVNEATRRVDLGMEMLDLDVDARLFRIRVRIGGLSVLLIALALASRFISEQSLLTIIQALLNR
jgi:hypothetical protein